MSNDLENSNNIDARELTVSERIELGRAGGHPAKGAIVPFPPGLRGRDILEVLRGNERKKVEGFLAHGFEPTVYQYKSAEGEVIQAVLRFDHAAEPKEIRPLRYYGKDKHGLSLFGLQAIDGQRPLYGLHYLAQRPDAPVLVVEGEKAADAAAKRFPDHVVVTWMSGAASVRRTDLSPLPGRRIVIWPDNDIAGRKAGRLFAALALKAGAEEVRFVDVPREFGEQWDLANEVPAECRDAYPLRHLLETARVLSLADLEPLTSDAREKASRSRLLGHPVGYSKVDKQAVADALSELDAGMSRDEWIPFGRCLYKAYGADGLPLFDEWSSTCAEKYRAGEPAALWESFAAEQGPFQAKSLAWLMRQARDVPRDEGKNFQLDRNAFAKASIEEINENHAVVTRGSKTVVLWEQFDPRTERYTLSFLKRSDFEDKLVWKIPLPNEKGGSGADKSVPLGKLWFGSGWRRQYDAIYFAPGQKVGARGLNTWTGFAVEPTDNPAGWSRLKDHLRHNVAQGDEAAYEYILNWLAFGVQRLREPVGTALVLQGAKGAGKSILIVLYGFLFGSHTWVTSISEDIVGRFNAHLETTLLLGVEEAFAPQNRAADGTLKDLITNKQLRYEDKFFSAWRGPSHLRIIMTSNNDHVVRADGMDRRYAVFEVVNPHQGDPDARRRYFGEMVEQMENGGYEAMLGELLARDISGWNPEAIPETEALRRQKKLNLSNDPVTSWLESRLEDGINILSGETGHGAYPWSETETVWVPVSAVLADYTEFAKRNGHRGDDKRLMVKLVRYMPPGFAGKPRRDGQGIGAPVVRSYPFPPLGEARRLFTEKTGFKFD